MKSSLHLGLASLPIVCLAIAAPAMAADSETVGVAANVTASCKLTTLLDPVEIITAPFPGQHNLGNLGYICNFGSDLQYPSLKIKAPGGTALVNTTDGHSVQYRVQWNVPQIGPAQFYTSAPPTSGNFQFPGDQGLIPNVPQSGSVIIDLLGDLTHAGTYSDILTFSVSP